MVGVGAGSEVEGGWDGCSCEAVDGVWSGGAAKVDVKARGREHGRATAGRPDGRPGRASIRNEG